MTRQWPAPAKINLFLYITGYRADGYHLLQTLFQFLDYGDILTITPTIGGHICLLNPIPGIANQDNLIVRAARLLQHHCWAANDPAMPGANIKIKKNIPIGSGLGGGSSNAATTLLALNTQWNCGLNIDTLAKLGLTLGADIPVFVYGQSAFAEGIGERLVPAFPAEKWYLVAIPPVRINTTYIFNKLKLMRYELQRPLTQLMSIPFYNQCEEIVNKCFPTVKHHLSWLLKYAPSRLTGTGACVFAEFDTEIAAYQALSKIPIRMNSFVAKGINISPLYQHYQNI